LRENGTCGAVLFFGNPECMFDACGLYLYYKKLYTYYNLQFDTEQMFPGYLKYKNIKVLQHSMGPVHVLRPPQAVW
ncbi:MAG: hypothetical protein AABY22_28755, partial [Nanoarchaeota archaeon]